MKTLNMKLYAILFFSFLLSLGGCKEEDLNSEPAIVTSFSVVGKDDAFYKGKINEDNTITIKVSPYLDAEEVLAAAVPTFYLAKGATVSPDPAIPQNFAQEGGVKYTVTAEDKVTKRDYTVVWGVSDHLPDGAGFSYAEVKTAKNFVQLGYPGEHNNFNLPDSKLYGDLSMYHAYCGSHIVLLSRQYVASDANSPYGIKVVDKTTLNPSVAFNLGTIALEDLKMISSDYKGKCVGAVVRNGETEFFYWATPTDAPKSIGKIGADMASTTDGSSNFQVAGDISGNAWITAMAPRGAKGPHYRVKVSNGQLASTYSTLETGYSSTDCTGFQMIAPMNDSDSPSYVVGDTQGTPNTANSNKVYLNTFAGSTTTVMPGLWQNILQAWWVGTGFSTARIGGKSPFVSALVINGKSYVLVTSGTSWWHAAAVLNADLQTLAHPNLNITSNINRGWSYGAWADWYYDEVAKEAHLAVWFGRDGLKTYKLTCFE
ncbi:DUF5018 domain-containing protein [Sphingobacterium sp. SYP-B4668]|uniref:DUF5018 domain-containing protein n=1 Tax=Sphingobacterium sp. SYP-B4668 TaxID=2996035 RepID=UPI0022DDE6FC|nr:DUF5018 domain-containing protein [Sphingobacterium sp. SYP-B4668]